MKKKLNRCLFSLLMYCILCPLPVHAQAAGTDATTVSSAAEFDYPPFSLIDENRQATGFSVELLKASLSAMGHDVSFATGPWPEVKQMLRDGKVQVLPLVGRTPEREALFDFTFPYITMHGTIIVRDDNTSIHSLKDLNGRQVAVLNGDNVEEFLRRQQLGASLVLTDSFEEALVQLSEGQYDAVVIQKLLAFQLIRENNLSNLRSTGKPLEEFVQSFCFAVPEGQAELLSVLNEGLSIVMANGRFQELRNKWFSSIEQRKSRIIVGGDFQYPPYEFLDENGQPTGFNVELTRAIAEQLGLDITIELDAWNKTRERLSNGRIDIVQGMFYSVDRDRSVDFSPAHSIVGHSIITRKGEPSFKSLKELEGHSILVMEGDILHDLALDNGLEQKLITVATQEEALRRLAEGESDCALVARMPALYWIKKNEWENLIVSQESVLSAEYCYATLHGNDILLANFSEGLEILHNNGTHRQIYNKWFSQYNDPTTDLKTLMTYLFFGLLFIVGLLIAVSIWSRILKKQVQQKTAELQQEIGVRKQAEQVLHAEKLKFQILFEHVVDYALVMQHQGDDVIIVDLSESACRHHGYERHELIGQSITLLDANDVDLSTEKSPIKRLDTEETVTIEVTHQHKDGSIFPVEVTLRKLVIEGQELLLAVERDITLRKKALQEKNELEKHLRQKYKMEAVGIMAGGIAHNFNNNLAIILGNLELARMKNAKGESIDTFLENANIAVRRSRDLVQQILTYSRKETEKIEPFQPGIVIDETIKLLRSTMPTTVNLNYQPLDEDRLVMIESNSTKLEDALINLCTNAVHAMDEKGDIGISLHTTYLEQKDILPQYPCQEGPYISITVKDTGYGMTQSVLDKIFDPFYTTKGIDQGTGMGLATVQGFVKKSGGMIRVKSTPGQGSSFELLFPLITGTEQQKTEAAQDSPLLPRGNEHILLVDDEIMLAEMTSMMLSDMGYKVSTENSSLAGLQKIKDNPENFDLLITDQTMPDLTGIELITEAKKINPDLPVILFTGYSSKISETEIKERKIDAFCMKPLEMPILLSTIRNVLH